MITDQEKTSPPVIEPSPLPPPRLIGISLLPAAATLGNLLCGVAAIFCCLLAMRAEYGQTIDIHPRLERLFHTHIAAGAYLIVLAMIFDALDGRLARITRRTSEFGAQLDSISDIVSFGLAPTILFISLLLRPQLGAGEQPEVSSLQLRVGLLCAVVYVSCAAIRLARYNAENVKSEGAQRAFSGLPSPGAAAAVVALLALHENLRQTGFSGWGVDWANVLRWGMAATALTVGLLMVSRLDYMHVFNVYVRRKRPPSHLVWLVVILGIGWFSFEWLLVVVAFGYLISGLVTNLARRGQTDGASEPAVEFEEE